MLYGAPSFSFQSTLPARGATQKVQRHLPSELFQSTLPARGATPALLTQIRQITISIHAPRTGSDGDNLFRYSADAFQSTLPARGATRSGGNPLYSHHISIHAPRTGSDVICRICVRSAGNFNPRSPHGERPGRSTILRSSTHFNPRSPHGERRAGI